MMEFLGYDVWEWGKAILLTYIGFIVVIVVFTYSSQPDVANRFLTFEPFWYGVIAILTIVAWAIVLAALTPQYKYGYLGG